MAPEDPNDALDIHPLAPRAGRGDGADAGQTHDEERSDSRELVTVRGELDMANVDQLVDWLDAVTGSRSAVVDLSEVTFIDSAGIHGLMRAHEAAEERGDQLILRNPSLVVRRILEWTGLTDMFVVETDGDDPRR